MSARPLRNGKAHGPLLNGAALLGDAAGPPTTIVAAPCYPGAFSPAKKCLYRNVSERSNIVTLEVENSLLTKSFNTCLAGALNYARQNPQVKFFAMLHADIQAQPNWLDGLFDAMNATGAEVASAVVPIKDDQGLTSTGIDDPENPFEEECRLTMHQIAALPADFTAKDAGWPDRALLINTGCWVCRLDRPWVRRFALEEGFHVADRILELASGELVAQAESEDWRFSRWLYREGIPYVATRRVQLGHFGMSIYPNQVAWGRCETDPNNTPEMKALRRRAEGRATEDAAEPALAGAGSTVR